LHVLEFAGHSLNILFLDVSYAAVIKWRRDSVAKRTTGVVRCFDGSKGYGYIDAKDGEDVFVHYSSIVDDESGFKRIYEGDEVEFEITEGKKGPQASNVTVTKKGPRPQYKKRDFY